MKSTKKSLFVSVLSLLLCVAMLLGTTYAWFTDSVTSGKNTITAGNLDIDVKHTNANVTTAESIDSKTNLFCGIDGKAIKWEPGVVAYENFTVENVGDLALKYNLALAVADYNAVNGTTKTLKDVLKVKVLTGNNILSSVTRDAVMALNWTDCATIDGFRKDGGNLYPAGTEGKVSSESFQVLIYWLPSDNDNDYNMNNGKTTSDGKPLFIEFGVNVVAAQLTYEKDSFDDQYDLSAELPVLATFPSIKEADLNTDKSVKVEGKGAIKSAEVPTKGVASVFNELKKDETTYSNDLTLTLDVKENGNKETVTEDGKQTVIDLDINMSAVMTSTNVETKEVTTQKKEKVESLDEFTTIEMNIGTGYSEVSVLHKGVDMQKLSSAADTPTDTTNGGYFYSDSTGVLTLKTKTFSPFTVNCFKSNMPKKGTLIKMDLVPSETTVYPVEACPIGDDGKETYRILKVEGKQALVLAMYDVEKELEFASSATKATFSDNSQYLKYEGSKVDIALNTTFYGKLTQDAKSAIVTKSIDQSAYEKWYGTIAGTTYTDNKINEDADIKFMCKGSAGSNTLLGAEYKAKVSVGERNVFALDLSEIDEYFAKESEAISADELFELFYHMAWNENLNSEMPNPKLRTGSANETSYAWYLSGTTSFSGPLTAGYNMSGFGFWGDFPHAARPAFYIDLSQIDWATAE